MRGVRGRGSFIALSHTQVIGESLEIENNDVIARPPHEFRPYGID